VANKKKYLLYELKSNQSGRGELTRLARGGIFRLVGSNDYPQQLIAMSSGQVHCSQNIFVALS
jgi:hypothetical protein